MSFAKRIKIASPAMPRAITSMARGCDRSDWETSGARRRSETMSPLEPRSAWAT